MQFIINTITSWDEPERARHQLTRALVRKGHQVVFVEKNRKGWFGIQTSHHSEDLVIVSPVMPVDYRFRYRIPFANEIYQHFLFRWLKKRYADQVVINFDFTAYLAASAFSRTIYYCNDYYIGNSSLSFFLVDWYHRFCETRMIRRAQICCATSKSLVTYIGRFNPNVHYIPLGANIPDGFEPSDHVTINKLKPIKVGLVGFIGERYISVDILNRIVREAEMELSIVGPVEDGFTQKLDFPERINFTGILKGEALTKVIADFDVCIAAYNIDRINMGTTPNKMWQYFMLGKPVVINNIPNISDFSFQPGILYVAKSTEEFIELIYTAFNNNSAELYKQRVVLAKANSWDNRATEFLNLL